MGEQGRCKDCRFWEQIEAVRRSQYGYMQANVTAQQLPVGRCHAGPPVASEWPQKHQNDWCGQFQLAAVRPPAVELLE